MAYDDLLYDRLVRSLNEQKVNYTTKKMFGGLCFMIDDKMAFGVHENRLMVRLDPDIYPTVLKEPGCRPMDFTGRPMRGFVFVEGEGIDTDSSLVKWINYALEFNPRAKSSKKKKKKV